MSEMREMSANDDLAAPRRAPAKPVESDDFETMMAGFDAKKERFEWAHAMNAMRGHGALGGLMRAAYRDDPKGIHAALAAGAEVDGRDGFGETACLLAARQGCANALRALLGAGADPNLAGFNAETPLMRAVMAHPGSVACCQMLLAAGAGVEARGHDAADGRPHRARRVEGYSSEKDAWGCYAPMSSTRWEDMGDQVLSLACQSYSCGPEVMEMLIKAGADVDDANRNGITPMMVLASMGSVDKAFALGMAGARLDLRDSQGFDAERYWVESGHPEGMDEARRGRAERERKLIEEGVSGPGARAAKGALPRL